MADGPKTTDALPVGGRHPGDPAAKTPSPPPTDDPAVALTAVNSLLNHHPQPITAPTLERASRKGLVGLGGGIWAMDTAPPGTTAATSRSKDSPSSSSSGDAIGASPPFLALHAATTHKQHQRFPGASSFVTGAGSLVQQEEEDEEDSLLSAVALRALGLGDRIGDTEAAVMLGAQAAFGHHHQQQQQQTAATAYAEYTHSLHAHAPAFARPRLYHQQQHQQAAPTTPFLNPPHPLSPGLWPAAPAPSSSSSPARLHLQPQPGPGFADLETTTRLLLPAWSVGRIIGKGGDVIMSIRELSQAHITILQSGTDHRSLHFRLFVLQGPIPAVALAMQLIGAQAGLFDDDPAAGAGGMLQDPLLRAYGVTAPLVSSAPEDPGIRMVIESSMVGQLLGRKGRRVQEVKAQTGVRRIQVLTAEGSRQEGGVRSERVVLLLGKGDACRRAHQLISTILAMDPQELQRREEEQLFSPFPPLQQHPPHTSMHVQQRRQHQALEIVDPITGGAMPMPMHPNHPALLALRRDSSSLASSSSSSYTTTTGPAAATTPFALPPRAALPTPQPQQAQQPQAAHAPIFAAGTDDDAPSVAAGVLGHDRRGSTDQVISASPPASPKTTTSHTAASSSSSSSGSLLDCDPTLLSLGGGMLGMGGIAASPSPAPTAASSSSSGSSTSTGGGGGCNNGSEDAGGGGKFSSEVVIRISNDNIGRLIGKEGCIIRRIRQESQCRIEIDNCPPTRDFALRSVRVRGHIAQTHVATAMILRQMMGGSVGEENQGVGHGIVM